MALFCCPSMVFGQNLKQVIDYHVHIFSDALLNNLKQEKYGANFITGDPNQYTDIEQIISQNPVKKLVLISTAYGFRLNRIDPDQEIRLVLAEHNRLSTIADKHPDQIYPFYGIHPLRPYALEAIKRCHQILHFTGIKLHFNASQVDFRKAEHIDRLKQIFAYTGEHQIPTLIHFSNHRSDFGEKEVMQFFHDVLDPAVQQTIIFAHMGGGGWITERSIITIESILSQIESSIGNAHEIYFELSGIIHEKWGHKSEVSDYQKNILIKRIGMDKILFGSDYPVANSASYLKSLQHRLKLTAKEMKQISQRDIFSKR